MKNRKKTISAILTGLFVLSSFGTSFTLVSAEDAQNVNLRILATSDMHGKFLPFDYAQNAESTSGSMAQLATAIHEERTDNTILVDAGDTIQNNSADLFFNDEIHPMIEAMNLIGYDVVVFGNHEFNYGIDTLKNVYGKCEAQVLCGNVKDTDGKELAAPYTIIEKDGIKIGIIGMVTPNITRWDSVNLEGCTVEDPVEETKKAINELKDQTDVLIAVEHMGESNEYDTANSGVTDLANACPELDLIVAAHEHKLVEGTEINGVLVVENKDSASTLAEVDFQLEKEDENWTIKDRTSKSISIADYEADPEITKALSSFDEKAKEDANVVIGKLEGGNLVPDNEIEGIPQAQIQDTAMIDLINAVQMYYTDADISAAAMFDTKSRLDEGDIRKCDTSLIYKYSNTLYKLEITGKQLKQYMEWSVSYYNTYHDGDLTISFNPDIRAYNYDMFAGVNYDINIANEPGSRIENLTKSDGTPVEDNDTFIMAVNNYRANSQLLTYGEVFQEGDELPVLLEMDVEGSIGGVRELIRDYIEKVKGGVITPEVDNNWKIIGNDWDETDHEAVVEAVKTGTLSIPISEDGRTPNIASITKADLGE